MGCGGRRPALPAWNSFPASRFTWIRSRWLRARRSRCLSAMRSRAFDEQHGQQLCKNGVVEHPVHKKYMREHLVKLMMTSLLKQVLSIQDISVLFSGGETATALRGLCCRAGHALHETAALLQDETDETQSAHWRFGSRRRLTPGAPFERIPWRSSGGCGIRQQGEKER